MTRPNRRHDTWTQHERSQLLYFRGLTLQQKMEAVEGMAGLMRHFERKRAEGAFRPAAPRTDSAEDDTPAPQDPTRRRD